MTETPHEALNTVFEYMYLKSKETSETQYTVTGIGTLKFERENEEWKQAK